MMLLGRLAGLLGNAALLACVATVATQAAGFGLAWSRGLLHPDKVVRYAGVMYGLDPIDLSRPPRASQPAPRPETREDLLTERVSRTPFLAERSSVIEQNTTLLRGTTLTLKRHREKYEYARDGFAALLDELESGIDAQAFRDLQTTMEIISAKQAKDILRSMSLVSTTDPSDDVLRDIVRIVKSLPTDKLRKILAEFKSEDDKKLLHYILLEIGELDQRTAQIGGGTP